MDQITVPPNYAPEQAGILSSLFVQIIDQETLQRIQNRSNSYQIAIQADHYNTEVEFNKLVTEWKSAGRTKSLVSAIAIHPAYQRIIGMGPDVLPLILRELQRELDHWFWALEVISREDPVPEESKGDLKEMARIWLKWGREHGYVR